MKDSRLKVDELLIDDLVSGQLSGEQYRSALRALDADPAKWRDCALAFLEEQALRTELRALAQGTINWSVESSAASTTSLVATSLTSPTNKAAQGSPSSYQLGSGFRGMLSTAALLLVSFTVGWLGSEVLAERKLTADANKEANALVDGSSKTMQVPDSRSSIAQSTPQFFDRPGAFDRGIPKYLRELEVAGRISVESYETLMPTTLEDGSAALMPVQQLILGPGKLERY